MAGLSAHGRKSDAPFLRWSAGPGPIAERVSTLPERGWGPPIQARAAGLAPVEETDAGVMEDRLARELRLGHSFSKVEVGAPTFKEPSYSAGISTRPPWPVVQPAGEERLSGARADLSCRPGADGPLQKAEAGPALPDTNGTVIQRNDTWDKFCRGLGKFLAAVGRCFTCSKSEEDMSGLLETGIEDLTAEEDPPVVSTTFDEGLIPRENDLLAEVVSSISGEDWFQSMTTCGDVMRQLETSLISRDSVTRAGSGIGKLCEEMSSNVESGQKLVYRVNADDMLGHFFVLLQEGNTVHLLQGWVSTFTVEQWVAHRGSDRHSVSQMSTKLGLMEKARTTSGQQELFKERVTELFGVQGPKLSVVGFRHGRECTASWKVSPLAS